MRDFQTQVLLSLGLSLLVLYCSWLTCMKFQNIKAFKLLWGPSFFIPFFVNFYYEGLNHGNIILFLMIFIWSLRLFTLALFNKSTHPYFEQQDQVSFFNFFFWTTLHIGLCTALYAYLFSPNSGWSAPFWNLPLAILFLLSFFLEMLSDFQNKPKGLYRFFKRPHYIFEITIWLSFGLLALPFTMGHWFALAPLASIFCLRHYQKNPGERFKN